MAFNWLNEDSRTFLSRGYLEEGVSAEERIEEIAEAGDKLVVINFGAAWCVYGVLSPGIQNEYG